VTATRTGSLIAELVVSMNGTGIKEFDQSEVSTEPSFILFLIMPFEMVVFLQSVPPTTKVKKPYDCNSTNGKDFVIPLGRLLQMGHTEKSSIEDQLGGSITRQ
jgi:hypothetical protein